MRVEGAREAAADLMALAKKSPKAMERSLYKYGNDRMRESKRLVPVEFGDLRDSGSVDEPTWEGDNLTSEVGYGGAAQDYALAVHEDMEAHHDDGQAKFLEIPLNAAEPTFDRTIGADFENFLGIK